MKGMVGIGKDRMEEGEIGTITQLYFRREPLIWLE